MYRCLFRLSLEARVSRRRVSLKSTLACRTMYILGWESRGCSMREMVDGCRCTCAGKCCLESSTRRNPDLKLAGDSDSRDRQEAQRALSRRRCAVPQRCKRNHLGTRKMQGMQSLWRRQGWWPSLKGRRTSLVRAPAGSASDLRSSSQNDEDDIVDRALL